MKESRFVPPKGAFTRTVPIRFSHCDPAGIVYFPHYFDMFNGLIEDWYTEQLGVEYAKLILGDRHGFPFVHIETDFKLPSRMGERLDLTLLLERIGRSSLSVIIIGHLAGIERLRARLTTAMTSLETQRSIELPSALRDKIRGLFEVNRRVWTLRPQARDLALWTADDACVLASKAIETRPFSKISQHGRSAGSAY